MKIYKYSLPYSPGAAFTLGLPVGAEPIAAGHQDHGPVVWCLINERAEGTELIWFVLAFTGSTTVPPGFEHVDSWTDVHTKLVYHLLWKPPQRQSTKKGAS